MIITVKDKHTLILMNLNLNVVLAKMGFPKINLKEIKKHQLENMLWALCILEGIEKNSTNEIKSFEYKKKYGLV